MKYIYLVSFCYSVSIEVDHTGQPRQWACECPTDYAINSSKNLHAVKKLIETWFTKKGIHYKELTISSFQLVCKVETKEEKESDRFQQIQVE